MNDLPATIPDRRPATGEAGAGCVQRFVGRLCRATLILGDSETMGRIEADALVSDPPYGIDHKVERTIRPGGKWDKQHTDRIMGDQKPFEPTQWLDYAVVVLWGANHYASRLPDSAGWLVWDKRRGGTHNQDFVASDCELAWCNSIGSVKIKTHLWAGLCRDSEVGEHLHPMQKPVVVMGWAMDAAKVPEGATVLDPYMGSGTTGIACLRTGRNFIGVEKDKRHFDTACKRMSREIEGVLL